MENLTFTEWILIISIVLTLVSIVIHLCVFVALKKITKSTEDGVSLSETETALKVGLAMAQKAIKSITPSGVKDAVGLVKDIITTNKNSGDNNE